MGRCARWDRDTDAAVKLRAYTPADLDACVEVLRSSVPAYTLPQEVEDYAAWLARDAAPGGPGDLAGEPCEYLVGELGPEDAPAAAVGRIVCAGGVHYARTAPVAILCWGIVHADFHRRGLGSVLLRERLARVRARGCPEVVMDTTDAAVGFFLRHGFGVTSRQRDGYGAGVDRLELVYRFA